MLAKKLEISRLVIQIYRLLKMAKLAVKSVSMLLVLFFLMKFNIGFKQIMLKFDSGPFTPTATRIIDTKLEIKYDKKLRRRVIAIESQIKMPDNSDDYKWNLGRFAFSLLPLAPGILFYASSVSISTCGQLDHILWLDVRE